jgi:hypothetical protein
MVCRPREEGGLRVIDLQKQNEALLLKNLDKFFNRVDTPWVSLVWEKHYPNGKLPNHIKKDSFWWRDVLKLLNCYKDFSLVEVKNDQSCLLWSNNWNTQPLQTQIPKLCSFAKKE